MITNLDLYNNIIVIQNKMVRYIPHVTVTNTACNVEISNSAIMHFQFKVICAPVP